MKSPIDTFLDLVERRQQKYFQKYFQHEYRKLFEWELNYFEKSTSHDDFYQALERVTEIREGFKKVGGIDSEIMDSFQRELHLQIKWSLESSLGVSNSSISNKESETSKPSVFWASLLLPNSKSEDEISCLQEIFYECWLPRYGFNKARWIFKIQMWSIIVAYWKAPLIKGTSAVAGYCGLTWVGRLFKN